MHKEQLCNPHDITLKTWTESLLLCPGETIDMFNGKTMDVTVSISKKYIFALTALLRWVQDVDSVWKHLSDYLLNSSLQE